MTCGRRFLFIPGGPGFNGFAEAEILASRLQKSGVDWISWHEPSRFRPNFTETYSFKGWIDSLKQAVLHASKTGPITLVGHSFGAIGAALMAAELKGEVNQVILVAPAMNLFSAHQQIIRLAIRDFEASDPAKARRTQELLSQTQSDFDAPMEAALTLACEDPLLLTHYWRNPEALQACLKHWSTPESQVDLQAFFEVSRDYARNHASSLRPVEQPVLAIFGEQDPVSQFSIQSKRVEGLCPSLKTVVLPGVSHFVHLDDPEAWIKAALGEKN